MAEPLPLLDDEAEAEARALAAAVAVADPRRVPHGEVREWLLRLANGEFDASPPRIADRAGRAPSPDNTLIV